MGAIFGVYGPVSAAEMREMGRRLAHRGQNTKIERPSDDLTVGVVANAPSTSIAIAENTCVVFDGVIYNADQLIRQVADSGDVSAAVLVHLLYDRHGPAGIEAIDGDFAFALVNTERREITFGRDYFGCVPLYFARLPDGAIAFASEYKGILAVSRFLPEIDRPMVQFLQGAKRLPLGRTLLANVEAASPGATTVLRLDSSERDVHRFPTLEVDARVVSEGDAVQLVASGLHRAVERRTRDMDRLGIALSGGVDSIIMAFLFRELYPGREIHTFTAGHGPEDKEIATAATVAAAIGSTHHEVITPPDLLRGGLRSLVWHLEDPFARTEALQLYELGRVASGFVDVVYSAQGADGLFGGMPKYKLLWLMKGLPPLRTALEEFYNLTQLGLRPRTLLGRCLEWTKFRGRVPEVPTVVGARLPDPLVFPPMSTEFINATMSRGLQAGVCQDIQKFERGFGAWGVGYRSPFYDLEFVRMAYTITDRLKVRRGKQKYILRRSFAPAVPRQFIDIPKFPQRMLYDREFADVLDGVADSVLSQRAVEARGLFEYSSIERLRRRQRDGSYTAEGAMRIWTAMLTELWAQAFVDDRGAGSAAGVA